MLYLNDVDHYIKEQLRIKYYIRYMDDLILFVKDKKSAREIFNILKEKIEAKGLELNPKSDIHPIENGVKFLKVHFKLTDSGAVKKRISKESVNKELRRITVLLRLYKENKIDYEFLLTHFNSWVGHFRVRMSSKQFPVINHHIVNTMKSLGMDEQLVKRLNKDNS